MHNSSHASISTVHHRHCCSTSREKDVCSAHGSTSAARTDSSRSCCCEHHSSLKVVDTHRYVCNRLQQWGLSVCSPPMLAARQPNDRSCSGAAPRPALFAEADTPTTCWSACKMNISIILNQQHNNQKQHQHTKSADCPGAVCVAHAACRVAHGVCSSRRAAGRAAHSCSTGAAAAAADAVCCSITCSSLCCIGSSNSGPTRCSRSSCSSTARLCRRHLCGCRRIKVLWHAAVRGALRAGHLHLAQRVPL